MGHETPTAAAAPVALAGRSLGQPIRGGIRLMLPEREGVVLGPGETVAGRSSSCDLTLSHRLVSRRHAVVRIAEDRATIEDLGSANGTFVNGAKISTERPLAAGDRVLIGTLEFSVFQDDLRASGERTTLDIEKPDLSIGHALVGVGESDTQERTVPAAAHPILLVGKMADAMLRLGKVREAERVLAQPLDDLDAAASAGRNIPGAVLEGAGLCAAKVASASRDGAWIDRTFALHTAAGSPMSRTVVDELCKAARVVASVDRRTYERHLEFLRARQDGLSPAEALVFGRLECMTLPVDRPR